MDFVRDCWECIVGFLIVSVISFVGIFYAVFYL